MHLISEKLVKLVEYHSDEIVERWAANMRGDPGIASYTTNSMANVQRKASSMLNNFGQWVGYETTKQEVGKRYAQEGKEMFDMKIPLCEAIRSMTTLRRTLWLYLENESEMNSAFQLNQMQELADRVVLFFDRAQYYLIRGYTEQMNRQIKELWNLKAEDTDKIFFERSFYNR